MVHPNSCIGKVPHKTSGAAYAAMKRILGEQLKNARTYLCQSCGDWHWGTVSRGPRYQRTVSAVDKALRSDDRKRKAAATRLKGSTE